MATTALANNDLVTPLVPMAEYPFEYRTLNCWECFEAQGSMCHHEDYAHDVNFLQSGNWGDGICCKNGATSGACFVDESNDMHCSPPSIDDGGKYKDVMTQGNRNYQLFAFCPGIDQKRCGISDKAGHREFELHASEGQQSVGTSEMRYRDGGSESREYDACHYMIYDGSGAHARRLEEEDMGARTVMKPVIHIKVTSMQNMNVYLYGGQTRDAATVSVVPNNEMPTIGEVYMVDTSEGDGLLVIAFPNKDIDTQFEFSYWTAMVEFQEGGELQESDGEGLIALVMGIVGFCLLGTCIGVVCYIRKKRMEVHKVIGMETDRVPLDGELEGVTPSNIMPVSSAEQLEQKEAMLDEEFDFQEGGSKRISFHQNYRRPRSPRKPPTN